MKRSVRYGFLVLASFIALASVVYANPDLAEDWGLDFWNYSDLNRQLKDTQLRSEILSSNHESTRWRLQYRESLIEDLISRRLTPEQVLTQFAELNRHNGLTTETLELMLHTKTERKCAAKQVILYLDAREFTDEEATLIRRQMETILAN